MVRRESLTFLHHGCGGITGPQAHQEVDMIGLNGKFHNLPPSFSTLLLDKSAALGGDVATQDGFPSLRAPDEMVDNEVHAVFVSLRVYVDILELNNININNLLCPREVKTVKAPHLYRSSGEACGGLKPSSVTGHGTRTIAWKSR